VEGEDTYVSAGLKEQYKTTALHVDVNLVRNGELDIDALRAWRGDFKEANFILEDGVYRVGEEVEKMSKRWHNVINPDDVVAEYGADCLRMYEMFLGPLEQHKPWNTQGLSGVQGFLRKLWRLAEGEWSNEAPSAEELKVLHKTIKKVTEDIEQYAFNTAVSAFMICVNELTTLRCNKRAVLEPLLIILSPFAPHIAEELWCTHGNSFSVTQQSWPAFDEAHLVESSVLYPISFNGKVRFKLELPVDMNKEEVAQAARADERFERYTEGKTPKKIIVVPGRIVNIVL
jgi:leucyl-tRNA synthetase